MIRKLFITLFLLALMKPIFNQEASASASANADESGNAVATAESSSSAAADEGEPSTEMTTEEEEEEQEEEGQEEGEGEGEGEGEEEEEGEEEDKKWWFCPWGSCQDQCCRLNWEGRVLCCNQFGQNLHCCGQKYHDAIHFNGGSGEEVFAHHLALQSLAAGQFSDYEEALNFFLGVQPVYPVVEGTGGHSHTVGPAITIQPTGNLVVTHDHNIGLGDGNYAAHNHHDPHYVHPSNFGVPPYQVLDHLYDAGVLGVSHSP